jgi:hypothetical protein
MKTLRSKLKYHYREDFRMELFDNCFDRMKNLCTINVRSPVYRSVESPCYASMRNILNTIREKLWTI